MPTIPVPAPPRSAFNKNRPISDLLQHQLKHFQHIEAGLPTELHSNMTARDFHTENGAAKYIAHITNALRALHQPAAPIAINRRSSRSKPRPVIAIAAETASPSGNGTKKKLRVERAQPAPANKASITKKPRSPKSRGSKS